MLSSLSDDRVTIINALSAAEHNGRVNRFPRPGRIAGSVNIDFAMLSDLDTQTFLPQEKLRALFEIDEVLQLKPVVPPEAAAEAAQWAGTRLWIALRGGEPAEVEARLDWFRIDELPRRPFIEARDRREAQQTDRV